jgi:protein ImuB
MYAVLLLPQFHLQAALRWKESITWMDAVALTKEGTAQGIITEATPSARATGVHPGMSSSTALARCPQLQFMRPTPTAETHTQAALLQITKTLSPFVESTAPGVCTADLRNTLNKRHEASVGAALKILDSMNLHASAGIAGNPDIARLAAHKGRPICIVHGSREFLNKIPLSELTDASSTLQILSDWGIHSTSDLLRLPKQQALERLGVEGRKLWSLAAGGVERPLRIEKHEDIFEEGVEFEHEIETSEPLMFAAQRLLDSLIQRLLCADRVAEKIHFKLPLANGGHYERTFTIPSPTLQLEILQRIIFTHLESLQLTERPVGLRIKIAPTLAKYAQFDLFNSALKDPNRFAETLGRLEALLGASSIGVPAHAASHHPDDFTLLNAVETFESMAQRKSQATSQCLAAARSNFGIPLRRLRPPICAEIETRAHRPHFIRSTLLVGAIAESQGPFRISGNWWETPWELEEWDIHVPNQDTLARIRKDALMQWSLQGVY